MTDVTVTQADFAMAATQLGYPPDITRADISYWDGGTKLDAVDKRAKELADYRLAHSGEGRSNGAGEDRPLGRFGHHPDPATDFCEEVTHLESIVTDKELGLRADEEVPIERIARAMTFRVGGDVFSVGAKAHLRDIEGRAKALATLTSDAVMRAALNRAYEDFVRLPRRNHHGALDYHIEEAKERILTSLSQSEGAK